MAIQVNWTDQATQITAPQAYARILNILLDAANQQITLNVGIYINAAARAAGASPFTTFVANPPFSTLFGGAGNAAASAYAYLKTLPQFAGGIDVA